MGNLTPILVSNDALHLFNEDDGELSRKIYNAINADGRYPKEVAHKGYLNYVTIYPPMHSSADRLFCVSGGAMVELDPWVGEFMKLKESHPDLIKGMLKIAKYKIKECEKELKRK